MKKIGLLFLAALGINFALGQTTINSNITSNTTWDLAGSPYTIASDIRVDSGVVLTIDPGVSVFFDPFFEMDLHGDLSAIGTPTDSIYFTGSINNISYTNHINYRGSVELDYVHIRQFQESFNTDPAVLNNPNAAPSFKANNCSWILNTQCLVSIETNLSVAEISNCYFEENNFGVIGKKVKVTHSTFVNNLRGVSGSNVEVDSCNFIDNLSGIYVYLPFTARNSYFHNNQSGAFLILSTFGTPNTVSYLEGNEFDENPNSINVYRDTGMVTSAGLVIQNNIICSSSRNLVYQVLPGAPNPFPLLELANNCWCEWDSAAVVATFDNQSNQAINIMPMDSSCLPSLVYPGDANHDQIANNFDLLPIGLNFGQTGTVRANASLNWTGQRANDWGPTQANGRDLKHVDTDGDGSIGLDDTLAVNQNYGLTHNSWRIAAPQSGIPLSFVMPQQPVLPGDTLEIPVEFGTIDSQATSVYGLAFSVNYDPLLVDSVGVKVKYNNSWLGTKNTDMLTLEKDFHSLGRVDMALVRNDQAAVSGYGMICSLIIVISEDIAKKERPLTLSFSQSKAIDPTGENIDMSPQAATASIALGTNISLPLSDGLMVYPNPGKNKVWLELPASTIQEVELLGMEGNLIRSWKGNRSQKQQIDLADLPQGIYFLRVNDGSYASMRKLVLY